MGAGDRSGDPEKEEVMRTVCPVCGKALSPKRFRVRMSPLKAKLLDLVREAGPEGIRVDALLERLPIKGADLGRTLNVHISQINDKLAHTNWSIVGHYGVKFLVRKRRKALPKGLKSVLTQ